MKAVSLLSGGLDSVVATWLAAQEMEVVLALTCDYGQRAARQEIWAASQVAAALGVPHRVVPLPWMAEIVEGPMTDRTQALPAPSIPELSGEAAEQSAAAVWVPNRNGLLLNIAAVYAEVLGAEGVICGFNAEEGATFPDNTSEFATAAEHFFSFSTRHGCRVVSPTMSMTKVEIVRAGRDAGAPLDLTWSCYEAGPAPCGRCESCVRQRRAFDGAAGGAEL